MKYLLLALSCLVLLVACAAVIIWLNLTTVCPKCRRRVRRREVAARKIPGSESEKRESYYDPNSYTGYGARTVLYAKYQVYYQCGRCGHRWRRVKEKKVE